MSERFVYFSDSHARFQDPEAMERTYEVISKVQPDELVMGGDLFDADFASRFGNDEPHDAIDEYETAANILRSARKSAKPTTKCTWLLGNHEDNVARKGRLNRNLQRALEWSRHMEGEDKNWHTIPYGTDEERNCYRIGTQITMIHGDIAPANIHAPSSSLVQQCMRMNGNENQSVVISGHTHRPTGLMRVRIGSVELPNWWCVSGCLCQLNPPREWMKRKRYDNWGNGIVIGEFLRTKSPRKSPNWEIEPVIFNMGREKNLIKEPSDSLRALIND